MSEEKILCWFCEEKQIYRDKNSGAHIQIYEDEWASNHLLIFDNSGNEYAQGIMPIKYCPICGKNFIEI